jgi:methanogenic corrinoid protein MtbC1
MQRFLTPSELAAALGVGEMTVNRWGSDGRLQVLRTVDGKKRIALREALRFIRDSGSAVSDVTALGFEELAALKSPAEDDAALEDAVYGGRGEEAWGLTLAMYIAGRKVEAICEGPITRAMHRIGEAWKCGPAGIAHEHRSTVVASETIQSLKALLPQPVLGAGRALGCAMESDPYILPSMMVSTTLASLRWQEMNLGPNLPVDALLAAVEEHKPTLVWMSCSVAGLPEQFAAEMGRAAEVLAQGGISFVIGGRGWVDENARQAGGWRYLESLEQLVQFVKERAVQS